MLPSAISYKDPHGYVIREKEIYYRIVNHSYQKQYDHLIQSGLYDLLIKNKLITPFAEIENFSETPDVYKTLLPQQLSFISYPYEWCFDQWRQCALTFLEINLHCIAHNMILKDATPFNFCMQGGRFIMFDILSFNFYNDGDPWIAYRQFCECFLSPLSLMKYNGPQWAKNFSANIHGFELSFVSRNLPVLSYFNLACLIHIHLHAKSKNNSSYRGSKKTFYLTIAQLKQLWQSLSSTFKKWHISPKEISDWTSYYNNDIQTVDYMDKKLAIVDKWLANAKPASVIDLGANTGKFTVLASHYAELVVSIESDHDSLNGLYNACLNKPVIYPLYADLTNPSPALGWQNGEKTFLLSRLKAHTTLALAVIHHLRFTYNVPLQLIASFFSQITTDYLILEFVGKNDLKVKAMMANREDEFADYNKEGLKYAFSEYFTLIEESMLLEFERIIYLWRKK